MTLHHSGFIVHNIDIWEKQLMFEHKINDVVDPIQQARLSLYTNFGSSYIELIQPLNEHSYTWNSLQKFGNHFNHFCYSVDSKKELETIVASFRLHEILAPTPAILFDNKKVTFYYTRNRQVVEFMIHD